MHIKVYIYPILFVAILVQVRLIPHSPNFTPILAAISSRLKISDNIIEANGIKVTNPTALSTATRGNNKVELVVLRNGKKININYQLKTKGSLTKRRGLVLSNALISNKLSSNYSGISEQIFNSQKHLVVQGVQAGVASGKLRRRDIIMYVDGKKIKDLDDLYAHLNNKKQAEFFLRRASMFNDKIVFYDRYEKVKIEDLKFLEFDK